MGWNSLRALLQLPLAAIDFGAAGGTNFAQLELLRSTPQTAQAFQPLAHVGHTFTDMVDMCNALVQELGTNVQCPQLIISGGVKHFLDGYYAIKKSTLPSIYGQASAFLEHARGDYDTLRQFVQTQIHGLEMANAYLLVRP